jgi:large subunit ribosomal protein L17
MRHGKSRGTLNRFTSWNKATLKSLSISILKNQSIRTTLHRAKAVKPLVDSLIHDAKSNTLAAKRRAFQLLGDHGLVSLLFSDIAARFKKDSGGYTRIISLGRRRGDNAEMVIFELMEIKKKEAKKSKKEKVTASREEKNTDTVTEITAGEKKSEGNATAVKEKPPVGKKPNKKFLGGIKSIFKKERDSL